MERVTKTTDADIFLGLYEALAFAKEAAITPSMSKPRANGSFAEATGVTITIHGSVRMSMERTGEQEPYYHVTVENQVATR
jgi:hypothetical protein